MVIAASTSTMRRGTGTVALSSVGMMIGGSGAAIGVMTLASVLILVGGATDRPWVVDGEVTVRR